MTALADWWRRLLGWLGLGPPSERLFTRAQAEALLLEFDLAIARWPEVAENYLDRGNLRMFLGAPNAALADYDEYFRSALATPMAYAYRAEAYTMLQRWADAQADIDLCLRDDPYHLGGLVAQANLAIQQHRWADALPPLHQVLQVNPIDEEALVRRARVHIEFQQWELADADLAAVLSRNPHAVKALAMRGQLHLRCSRSAQALVDSARALRLDPGSVDALFARGYTLLDLGYLNELQTVSETYLRLAPRDPFAHYLHCDWLLHTGQFAAAHTAAEKLVQLIPCADTYCMLAAAEAYLDRFDAALATLATSQTLEPTNPHIYRTRARLLFKWDRPAEALPDIERALELSPDDIYSRITQALILHRLRRWDEAHAHFDRELARFPNYARIYLWRAHCWSDQGEHDRAIADIERTLRACPQDMVAANQLAWELATHPDAQRRADRRTIMLAQLAYRQASASGAVLSTLAAALATKGKFTEALTHAQHALRLLPGSGRDHEVVRDQVRCYEQRQIYLRPVEHAPRPT